MRGKISMTSNRQGISVILWADKYISAVRIICFCLCGETASAGCPHCRRVVSNKIQPRKETFRGCIERNIFYFSASCSRRISRAACTMFFKLAEVSARPRVFKPQSGLIQSFSAGILANILCTAVLISSTEGTRGE